MELNYRRSRGFTLLEIMVALAISTLAIVAMMQVMERSANTTAARAAASHAQTVIEASNNYIADNYSALLATATPTTPATVTPAQLATGGYLPPGFNPLNGFGQTFSVRVLEPTPGRLSALVVTTGGDVLDGQMRRRVAQLIGAAGGYVETSTAAEGAFGGWNASFPAYGASPGVGRLAYALFMLEAAQANDFLHRSNHPGQPELNRMGTDIAMDNNDLSGAGTVDANLVDAGRVVMPAGENLALGSTRVYGDSSNTAIRQSGTLYVQTAGGAGYAPVRSGAVTAAGTVQGATLDSTGETYTSGWFRTRGNSGWYSQAHGGGWFMQDPTWVRSYANKSVYTGGEMNGGVLASQTHVYANQNLNAGSSVYANQNVQANANVTAGQRVTAGEYLLPLGTATCNTACSTNGLIGRTPAGALLSCTSGQWKGESCGSSGGGSGGTCPSTSYCAAMGPAWSPCVVSGGGCYCPNSGVYYICP